MGLMYFPDEIDPKKKNKNFISKFIDWCFETPIRAIITLLILFLFDIIIFICAFSY